MNERFDPVRTCIKFPIKRMLENIQNGKLDVLKTSFGSPVLTFFVVIRFFVNFTRDFLS